jgi:hypothetical protein
LIVINHVKDVEYTNLKLETSNICTGLARRLKTSGMFKFYGGSIPPPVKKIEGLRPIPKHDLTPVRPSIPLPALPLAYSTPLLPFVSFLLTGMLGLANRQTERRQHQAKAKSDIAVQRRKVASVGDTAILRRTGPRAAANNAITTKFTLFKIAGI